MDSVHTPLMLLVQSLADLLKTLLDLSGKHTTIVMSYEERTTGNKPLLEKKFFEVAVCSLFS